MVFNNRGLNELHNQQHDNFQIHSKNSNFVLSMWHIQPLVGLFVHSSEGVGWSSESVRSNGKRE